jgi:hypothetical protein
MVISSKELHLPPELRKALKQQLKIEIIKPGDLGEYAELPGPCSRPYNGCLNGGKDTKELKENGQLCRQYFFSLKGRRILACEDPQGKYHILESPKL